MTMHVPIRVQKNQKRQRLLRDLLPHQTLLHQIQHHLLQVRDLPPHLQILVVGDDEEGHHRSCVEMEKLMGMNNVMSDR